MDNISSLSELYNLLRPAFNTKISVIHKLGFDYVKKSDIWNYLETHKWKNVENLLLYQMVDDILNADDFEISEYVLSSLKEEKKNQSENFRRV